MRAQMENYNSRSPPASETEITAASSPEDSVDPPWSVGQVRDGGEAFLFGQLQLYSARPPGFRSASGGQLLRALMEFVVEDGKQVHEDCSRLVVPALSIGNVGQLAVDLLISTLRAERIGFLDDPSVLPCVGNDAYGFPQGELALPLEAYDSMSNGLALVQQRSPVVKGMTIEFAKNLANFAVASGKTRVVILSSLDFGRWQRFDLSRQIYYLSSSNPDGTDDLCEQLGWKKLPEYNPDQRYWKYLSDVAQGNPVAADTLPAEDDFEEEDYYPSLPFAALYSCFKAKGLEVTCLLCYCSEGDNIPDAIHLAEASCKLLGISPSNSRGDGSEWIVPFSWKTVYGPPPDISMF